MKCENGGNATRKCTNVPPSLAWGMGVMLFVVGAMTVEAQSVEPQASGPPKGCLPKRFRLVVPRGANEFVEQASFYGESEEYGLTLRAVR